MTDLHERFSVLHDLEVPDPTPVADLQHRSVRRRRRRVVGGAAIISALVLGVAVLLVGGGDQTRVDTVDDPTPHVHLLPDGESSAEAVVPADGKLGPVLEVTAAGTPTLLSVTTGDEPLAEGHELLLIPADAEPEGFFDAPFGESPTGIPHSAFWTIRHESEVDQGLWFFLPEPPAQSYQLAVPSELAGTTLGLEIHPVEEPTREDLVGSWGLPDIGTIHFEPDGNVVVNRPALGVERVPAGEYDNRELRWDTAEEDTQDVYRLTLLPDGGLALVATDAPRVLGPPNGRMMVFKPVES